MKSIGLLTLFFIYSSVFSGIFVHAQGDGAIDTWLKEKNLKATKTESGLYFIVTEPGTDKSPVNGDMVSVHYTGTLLNGKKFDSSLDRKEPFTFQLGAGKVIKGWDEGILKFKEGGKGKLIIPPNLGYGDREMGDMIPANSVLVFDIELVSISSKAEMERKQKEASENQAKIDEELIKGYIERNELKAKKTASGLYYVVDQPGSGKRAEAGKDVRVHYKGTLLDGTKFDSSYDRNEPLPLTLGVGQVIKGWDEGIALFNEGGKGRLIIPSGLAYGPRSTGAIKANSVLVFEIEVVEVR